MGKDLASVQRIAFICNGQTCLKNGSAETTSRIRAAITQHGAQAQLHTIRTHCTDQCLHGPVVFIHPDGTWYQHVSADMAETLVTRHLLGGEPVGEAVLFQG